MTQTRVYFDWNATTPLRPEAREALIATLDLVGNPSSVHGDGRKARRVMEDARIIIGQAICADPRNVVFTSGGTEANSLALNPNWLSRSGQPIERLIVSSIEHASVMSGGRFPAERVTQLRVTPDGVIDLDHLRALLDGQPPALVSIMAANNETGAVQPIYEAAKLVRAADGRLHVDAVQAFGKIPLDINALQADMVSVSAHKIGGPKGVGALVLGLGVGGLDAMMRGGGQELGRRAGTENLPGIAAFGAAAKTAMASLDTDAPRIAALRDKLQAGLAESDNVTVIASTGSRLPNTLLIAVRNERAETLVIGFDLNGVSVSSGSACSSGKVQPSHVLEAMGYPQEFAKAGIRFSLGWNTTESDVEFCLKAWRKLSGTLVKQHDVTLLEPL